MKRKEISPWPSGTRWRC